MLNPLTTLRTSRQRLVATLCAFALLTVGVLIVATQDNSSTVRADAPTVTTPDGFKVNDKVTTEDVRDAVAEGADAAADPKVAATCAELGRVNIDKDDPDYDPSLDADGNGVACEADLPDLDDGEIALPPTSDKPGGGSTGSSGSKGTGGSTGTGSKGGSGGGTQPPPSTGGGGTTPTTRPPSSGGGTTPPPTAPPTTRPPTTAPPTTQPPTTQPPTTQPPTTAPPTTAPPTTQPPAQPVRDTAAEAQLRQLLNNHRASIGQPGLSEHGGSTTCASDWSRHMATTGVLSHSGTCPAVPMNACGACPSGENVGKATSGIYAIFQAWLGSPGHRANIEIPGSGVYGVGVYRHNGWTYATLLVAAK